MIAGPNGETASQVLVMIIAALGLAVDPVHFVFLMVVSISSGMIVSRERPKGSRRGLWGAVLVAIVISTLSAVIAATWFPGIPTAVAMIVGGMSSGFVMNVYVGVMTRIEDRAVDIADRLIDRVGTPRDTDRK